MQLILALSPGIHYAEDSIGSDSSLLRPDPANCISKGTVCTEPTCQTTQDFANQKMASGPVLSAPPKSGSRWETGAGGGEQLDDICCMMALEGFENHCLIFLPAFSCKQMSYIRGVEIRMFSSWLKFIFTALQPHAS